MAKREPLEAWELQLAREGEAISRMGRLQGPQRIKGKRTGGTKLNYKKTQVATVRRRDAAAVHVGFAPDRTFG